MARACRQTEDHIREGLNEGHARGCVAFVEALQPLEGDNKREGDHVFWSMSLYQTRRGPRQLKAAAAALLHASLPSYTIALDD